jgi:flagellar basal body-associated protein FliL
MNHPLVSLAAVVLAGLCLIAYLFGFSVGQDQGRDEGQKKGKEEGAVRAFAVGYDRGKRERAKEKEEKDKKRSADNPNLIISLLLVVGTVIVLTLVGVFRQQG